MKISVKQICITGAFLAICIVSQLFKNTSVYITGPIVNTALILTTIYCGPICGVILSVITPITAFFITGSPVMAAVPLLIPCIMLGNAILVICVALLRKPFSMWSNNKFMKYAGFPISMLLGSIEKAAVMGLLIGAIVLPNMLPEKMLPKLGVLQIQFSLTQLITAIIGSVYAWIIRFALRKTKIEQL